MKLKFFLKLSAVVLGGATCFGASAVRAQTTTKALTPMGKEERETVEKIVHEYLLAHPEVIREAMIALQEKEEAEKKQETAGNMKKFASKIYHDLDAPVLGNSKGDVTVVVFYDYFCGYCRKTIPGLHDLIAKDASLKIIYKEFPILGPDSLTAARAALAAARQGKFAAFDQAMIAADAASDSSIRSISDKIGIDYPQLQKDMADPKIAAAIARNIDLAESLNINGTPAYLIGDRFVPGAISTESLAKMIAEERKAKATPDKAKNDSEPK